jgi:hypothetical protein
VFNKQKKFSKELEKFYARCIITMVVNFADIKQGASHEY